MARQGGMVVIASCRVVNPTSPHLAMSTTRSSSSKNALRSTPWLIAWTFIAPHHWLWREPRASRNIGKRNNCRSVRLQFARRSLPHIIGNTFLDSEKLRAMTGREYEGGILNENAAQFWPAKFVYSLAQICKQNGTLGWTALLISFEGVHVMTSTNVQRVVSENGLYVNYRFELSLCSQLRDFAWLLQMANSTRREWFSRPTPTSRIYCRVYTVWWFRRVAKWWEPLQCPKCFRSAFLSMTENTWCNARAMDESF